MRVFAGIVALALLAGCHKAEKPAAFGVDHVWVRLPANPDNPAAAYFTVHGGETPTTLVAVSAPFAVRAEMHETMKMDGAGDHGMMAMKPVKDVAVPARGEVKFAPGGKHVMLFDVSPHVKAGDKAPLTLSFADGKQLQVPAQLVGPADAEPK